MARQSGIPRRYRGPAAMTAREVKRSAEKLEARIAKSERRSFQQAVLSGKITRDDLVGMLERYNEAIAEAEAALAKMKEERETVLKHLDDADRVGHDVIVVEQSPNGDALLQHDSGLLIVSQGIAKPAPPTEEEFARVQG